MTTTIRGEVANRTMSTEQRELVKAEELAIARVTAARGWFEKVVPRHIDAGQFTQLCEGVIRRGSTELKAALWQAPDTFFDAAAECARLGLVPGDNYFFAPFKNKKKGIYEVTGMRGYKGEMDLIYRACPGSAIHANVVRAADQFSWRPGTVPVHELPANEHGQVGLGSTVKANPMTGVWSMVVFSNGQPSAPVVLSAEDVAKYRAKAQTLAWWGPAWPAESDWTPNMWVKTALHRQYHIVPHSPEYVEAMLRGLAAVQSDPLGERIPATIDDVEEDQDTDESGGQAADVPPGD